ncbi:hypothetical protein J7443_21525 [Tropicibacter sp. R15_0]|uniref:hypothetical protein n=1 Tax=Tropicibacter sp. R15_0 TaxID=2821101 RepID=UPI001ADC253B|nr:hypothetical protein [Tropicibacter sp. R15_0]MBO9467825.1 hypothetical protein [Tropicibacter sp. R15_0]
MIASSKPWKLAAMVTALATHAALAVVLTPEPKLEIEGGPGHATARLGSSFSDLAQGLLEAEQAPESIEPVEVEPEQSQKLDTEHVAQSAPRPAEVEVSDPVEAIQPDKAPKAAQAQPQIAKPLASSLDAPVPVLPITAAALPVAAIPVQTTKVPELERIEASEPVSAAVSRSLRPQLRSAEFEAAHKSKAKPKPKPVAKPRAKPKPSTVTAQRAKPKPRGTGAAPARSGAQKGKAQGSQRANGSGGSKKKPGNAAASNYPGKVASYIRSRARIRGRGSARVSISISGSGQLTSVSSPNAKAAAAVKRLRRVPKPPAGARRSFAFTLQW